MAGPPSRAGFRWLLLLAALLLLPLAASAAEAADDGPDINAWIIENHRLDDGKHRVSVLFLYHRTSNPDGSTYSRHLLNWIDAPGFQAVLPLWYRVGEPGRTHSMLVPLWFQGPGYGIAPLALSGGWTREDGGHALWVTPLFHLDRAKDGSLEDMHLLTWLQGDGYRFLLPFFYHAGEPGQEHTGVIPLWFSGPRYWTVPLALSGGWTGDDGGRSDWVTPLFHIAHDQDGSFRSMHLLNWWHGRENDVVFPLWWSGGEPGARHHGLLPVWLDGPGYWAVPPLLSAGWRNQAGGRTTWITPLFHRSTDAAGDTTSFHILTWLHQADLDLVLPFGWIGGPPGHRSGAILPLYFQREDSSVLLPLWFAGKDWWLAPPLLSGGWHDPDGGGSLWLTPFFHRSHSGDGRDRDMHLLTWFSGQHGGGSDASGTARPESSYQVLAPFYYRSRTTADGVTATHTGVLPFWLGGPDYGIIPPLLTARWREADGDTTTWVTPLFHRTTHADGSLSSLHAGLWYQDRRVEPPDPDGSANGSSHEVLFPLYWRWTTTEHGTARSHSSLLPLWVDGPDFLVIPPLLATWHRGADGGSSTWVTPLFHLGRRPDGSVASMHALNWIQYGDTRILLPFFYRSGPPDARSYGIIPLWFADPNGWTAPLALSWHRRWQDGSRTTWVTPLAHVSRDADGAISSLHVLDWFQGRDWQALIPFWYRAGKPGQRDWGILPGIFGGPDYWAAPLALSGGWKRDDGGHSTWITPLAHLSRAADGSLSDMHVLTWFQGRDWEFLFPFWYRAGQPGQRDWGVLPLAVGGPGWWASPLALSGRWNRDDGGHSTWITPLFHVSSDRDGRVDGMHALTWLSGRDYDAFLPLAWVYGKPGERHVGVMPAWFSGPHWWMIPPLLSASWQRGDGGRSTWITPLVHVGSDASGKVTDWHALNVVHSGDTDVVFPLAWQSGPPGARSRVILPFWYQGPDWLVVAPLYVRKQGPDGVSSGLFPLWFSGPSWWMSPLTLSAGWRSGDRQTTMITPLFHRTSEAGRLQHMHLLTYIATPSMQALAPLFWSWRTGEGGRRTLLAPLWYQHSRPDGDFTATAIPLLFSYHRGTTLDTSFAYQMFPFLVQNAPEGSEINILWRLFHLRHWKTSTEVMVGPLWWSEHRPGEPASWQVLGGLFGRECDRTRRTSLSYALWGAVRFGQRHEYATP